MVTDEDDMAMDTKEVMEEDMKEVMEEDMKEVMDVMVCINIYSIN